MYVELQNSFNLPFSLCDNNLNILISYNIIPIIEITKITMYYFQEKCLSGLFHWCGQEKMTKYHMVLKMAEVFNLPHSHISGDDSSPQGTVARPYDTQLDCSRLTQLGFGTHTPFKEGIHRDLKQWLGP